jgi:hypothetical protein
MATKRGVRDALADVCSRRAVAPPLHSAAATSDPTKVPSAELDGGSIPPSGDAAVQAWGGWGSDELALLHATADANASARIASPAHRTAIFAT